MTVTRVFEDGNGQSIQIPPELRTEKKEFYIRKLGETYVVYPVDDPWATTRQVVGTFPQAFMEEREQPSWDSVPERETLLR